MKMITNKRSFLYGMMAIMYILCACQMIPTHVVDQSAEIEMAIAQTAAVQLAEKAIEVTDILATVAPTITPAPTATPELEPSATATVVLKDIALLMGVLSIGEGTELFPEEPFDVIWRLRNVGETTWTGNYSLVFLQGESMGKTAEIPFHTTVGIGEIIELRLKLTAPTEFGDYSATWLLKNENGETFGVDDSGTLPLQVQISVIDNPLRSARRQVLQFYQGFSTAEWYDQHGTALCEAEGNVGAHGQAYRDNAPEIQAGVVENEPSLIMIPAEGNDGFIAGKYPLFEVKAGDYFVTYVGCLDKGTVCDVTFRLDYLIEGESEIQSFGEWRQTHNGQWTEIRKNLTKLDGLQVQFILVVENNGTSKGDYAVWFVPAIFR